ncbi:hypothetical protein JD974_12420 [Chromobacterium haemolyticum]|uniref:Uncharacterized protein n=1 Tax=Chromobacterium haemolyticum TaxID=394935 RepID=A0ABS3GNE5_9NEIS|nr:hypothetical protein [Chromobacterium haemolyticum]MBK0415210.1 hypothetical protein [Chromobacterium haemolyticum]MBO0416575.1 hypothetical protein [Chromobacterium haemolyticum]MBO0499849.1 hypothetical protein [Chromobacterium haemolyticum]
MKRPRGNGLASKICDVLADAPRPMFLGEIEAALDFQHGAAEIMSVLVKLQKLDKIAYQLHQRSGPGRKLAKVYLLASDPYGIF